MSQKAGDSNQHGSGGLESGLETLRQSSAFRGPADPPDEHEHANDHLALLYVERDEQFAAALPFIREGLEQGEQCVYVADDNSRAEVRAAMEAYDINVDAALESGALSVLTPAETYRRAGEFDQESMLQFWEKSLEQAKDEEGYTGLRAAAEMTWVLDGETGSDELVEYEAVLNQLYQDEDYTVLCQYNRERVSAEVIHDVIKTHPHLIINNTVSQNFYYTPPEQFFDSEDPETKVNRMTQMLQEHTTAKIESREHKEYLRELYEVTADSEGSFEEKLQAIFDLGCERFDLELGGLARIDPETDLFEVDTVSGDHEHLEPGVQVSLSETYCRVHTDDREAASVGITNPEEKGFDKTAAYTEFGVESYLGTRIELEAESDRTLFFVSSDPRMSAFTEAERTLNHLMGEWVGYELERRRREQFLRECYEITSDPDRSFEEKLEQLLDLGCGWFGLDMAGLNHLPSWNGKFRLEKSVGLGVDPDQEVWTDPGEGCFCRRTITEDRPVALADVRGTDWAHDPIHQNFDLTSYLGTKIMSSSTAYGTLWFGSTEPREHEFSEAERTFIELMGQWVSYEIERRDHQQAQQELYEITADSALSFDEKVDRLLDLGRDRFDLDMGFLLEKQEEEFGVVKTRGTDLEEGVATLSANPGHYCKQTITVDFPVGVEDTEAAGWDDDPLYREYDLGCYLGTRVTAGDDVYGSVCFADNSSLEREFTDAEYTFLELMGQWLSYEFERQEREQELREQTEHLQALIETTPECIKTVAADGTLLQMNPAGLEMVEADAAEDVVGECVYNLIAPEDRDRFREFNERICQGERGTLAFDIIGLEGTRRHMETHAAPLHRPDGTTVQVALTRDVTEKKEREAELRESKNQLQALIDVLPVAVFVAEDDGEIVKWNDAAEEIWGGEVAESESVAEYAEYDGWWADTGEPVEPDEWALARALRGKEVTDPDEIEIEGFNGKRRTVLNHGMPVRDADGDVSRAVVTLVDITERNEREAALRQSNDRLKQFAYAASHDLQEPLRMVSSYLQLLENQYKDDLDEEAREYIDFAVDGADRMRAMVNDLLAFSRVEQADGEFEQVDCNAVLERVTDDLQVKIAETDAEVLAESLPTLQADSEQLEQVFSNLISNAIKYSGDGPPEIEITIDEQANQWKFAVADNGIGIEPDKTDRIFEVFKRLHNDNEYPGTGIGLSLCQEIVENHGGEIWVDSEPGEGSTFFFTIPKQAST